MQNFHRRQFLFASSGAAAGSFLATGIAGAAEGDPLDFSESGLVTGKPKPLKHKEIPGFLSAAQIAPHHTAHYGGALTAFGKIDQAMEESFHGGAKIVPEAFETMQRQKSSRGNSVILHEMYFDGLALAAKDPAENLRDAIEKRFGTIDRWSADFMQSAKAAAGWAMLVQQPVNGRLYNVVSDEHASGPLWLAMPLVVIDVYEHAFYVDYLNRKPEYIEKFMQHIDWNEAGHRFSAAT
jgi:superoxide dismutase, Fe-Mn family